MQPNFLSPIFEEIFDILCKFDLWPSHLTLKGRSQVKSDVRYVTVILTLLSHHNATNLSSVCKEIFDILCKFDLLTLRSMLIRSNLGGLSSSI